MGSTDGNRKYATHNRYLIPPQNTNGGYNDVHHKRGQLAFCHRDSRVTAIPVNPGHVLNMTTVDALGFLVKAFGGLKEVYVFEGENTGY